MSLKQNQPVVPPVPTDGALANFSQIIQGNLVQLFQAGHVHKIITAAPTARDGNVGDIYLGNLSTGKTLYAKFSDGWYAVNLTKV